MIKRIEGGTTDGDYEIKRFYLGVKIYADCPNCGEEVCYDGDDQYVLYGGPGINEVSFMCHRQIEGEDWPDECCEWTEFVEVTMNVTDTGKRRTDVTKFMSKKEIKNSKGANGQ